VEKQQNSRSINGNNENNWQSEIKEIISGASGGFLFGIPLLYTMEVWFIGSYVQPPVLLGILAVTSILIFLLNRIEGFRSQDSTNFPKAIAETIETLAIGITCSALILIILQRIDEQTPLPEILGKIIFEGIPFCLGVAFSRSILKGQRQIDSDSDSDSNRSNQPSQNNYQAIWQATLTDGLAAFIGSLFIAFSIAPTDEVRVLAASASPVWLLMIMMTSLAVSYGIVFAAEFTNYNKRRQQQGLFQSPESETMISYVISLAAGILMLWFFQQLALSDPWFIWLRYGIILSLPASIGGAAGRLAL
jgi:putative integral membrane protein (TIGR02587 family)